MATFGKLAQSEIDAMEFSRKKVPTENKGIRKAVKAQYDEMFQSVSIGDWCKVEMASTDKKVTVVNNLKRAASRSGYTLDFARASKHMPNLIRFRISQE